MLRGLRSYASKIALLRKAYRWVQYQRVAPATRPVRKAVVMFGLRVIYYGLVSPYAVIRRYVFRRSLMQAKAQWKPIKTPPMSTSEKRMYQSTF